MQLFLVFNKLTGFFTGFFGGFLSFDFLLLVRVNVVFSLVFSLVFFAEVKSLENSFYFGCLLAEISRFASLPKERKAGSKKQE